MAKVSTNISIDADIKKQAVALFNDLGMDLSTAINVYLRQAVFERRIPFELSREVPNAVTLEAMREAEEIISDPDHKYFDSVDDLISSLEAEDEE